MGGEQCLFEIDSKLDNLKDLLLGIHFQLDKIKDRIKETRTDVACLRVMLDQIIKEVTKLAAKIQATIDTFSTTTVTLFMNLNDITSQTLAYISNAILLLLLKFIC